MTVLVTGAGGFLGRRVVAALAARGRPVRALDRSGAPEGRPRDGVEAVRADLCESPDLASACRGVEAVVHLAAELQGRPDAVVRSAVEGTRRLLDAMEAERVPRLVLASSLSVYDWASAAGALSEESSLEANPELRDAYTTAKLRQEQLARERCARSGIALAVLRPAVLWGSGREYPPTIGQRIGPLHVVVAARRQLPLVHVDNCADAFAAVVEARGEGTFNLVDHPEITAGRFVRDHLRRGGRFGVALPAPYRACLGSVALLERLSPAAVRRRLPSYASPARFAARFKPVRVSAAHLRDAIGWRPPLGYDECLERTYGPRGAP